MYEDQYSEEEMALYNPAYTGFILLSAIREYCQDDSKGMHCLLPFIVLPVALNPFLSSLLPNNRRSALVAWLTNNQGALSDFPEQARAYRPLVLSALSLLLDKSLIRLSSEGFFTVGEVTVTKFPKFIRDQSSTNDAMKAAVFLGRWLVHAPPVETLFVQLGVKP